MTEIKLTPRLFAAANLCEGDFVADIGTDHAFLPIYLVQSGKALRAVASDIRPEPLARAREHIDKYDLSDKIETVLTNGLCGIEKYDMTDIVIAGMGGLNIIGILDGASFVKERRLRLVLQPMQNIPELAEYLCAQGYAIIKEAPVIDAGKVYRVMQVRYDGASRREDDVEKMLGAYNIAHKSAHPFEFRALCDKFISVMKKKVDGLTLSGKDAVSERDTLARLLQLRKEV